MVLNLITNHRGPRNLNYLLGGGGSSSAYNLVFLIIMGALLGADNL